MRLAMACQPLLPLLLLLLLIMTLIGRSGLSRHTLHLLSETQWPHAIDLTTSRSAHL